MSDLERLLTAQDVANLLGVPVTTLYQWRSRGIGPVGMRIGRHVRYDADDVRQWLKAAARSEAGLERTQHDPTVVGPCDASRDLTKGLDPCPPGPDSEEGPQCAPATLTHPPA